MWINYTCVLFLKGFDGLFSLNFTFKQTYSTMKSNLKSIYYNQLSKPLLNDQDNDIKLIYQGWLILKIGKYLTVEISNTYTIPLIYQGWLRW